MSVLPALDRFTPLQSRDSCSRRRDAQCSSRSSQYPTAPWSNDARAPTVLSPTTNCQGLAISASLSACLGIGTPIGVPRTEISYNPTASGVVGMCRNWTSGSTRSGSEALAGASTSADLFSNLATATAISQTMSNSQFISSRDHCSLL